MAQTYQIQAGDNLSSIGQRFGLNWGDLASWNNISNPNMIYAGQNLNLFNPAAQQAAPAQNTAPAPYSPPTPTQRTPFGEILPFDTIFNPGQINQMAQDQIAPDINRAQSYDTDTLMRNMASSGGFRTGRAGFERGRLADAYSRQLKEQTASFTGNVQDWLTDWYNRQSESYYKDPSGFVKPTVPTFDQYLQNNPALTGAYNNYLT